MNQLNLKIRSYEQLVEAIQEGAKCYDVRPREAFNQAHLEIAEYLSLESLSEGKLPKISQDTPVYLHCTKGIRSTRAEILLREAGFSCLINLGGIEDLKQLGAPWQDAT